MTPQYIWDPPAHSEENDSPISTPTMKKYGKFGLLVQLAL